MKMIRILKFVTSLMAKKKSETIVLDNGSSRFWTSKELSGLRGFSENEEKNPNGNHFALICLVVAIPLFTWVFRAWFLEAEQGIHYEVSGRRSGIKQLLANGRSPVHFGNGNRCFGNTLYGLCHVQTLPNKSASKYILSNAIIKFILILFVKIL